jgi:DNA-binding NarL/FixJ family response regulator
VPWRAGVPCPPRARACWPWLVLFLYVNGSDVARRPAKVSFAWDTLTPREVEVLSQVAGGLPNRDIAAELVTTEATIKTHVSSILSKLHLANRVQAALYALQEGAESLWDAPEREG